jgi:hypothetical protein
MTSTNLGYAALAAIGLLAAAPATPAFAQNFDSYVSATGSSIDCTITSPCSSIGYAVSQTALSGVVHCLDSADYRAPVAITQSITIDCSNTTAEAGAFTINGSGAVVHIIGLQVLGFGLPRPGGVTGTCH